MVLSFLLFFILVIRLWIIYYFSFYGVSTSCIFFFFFPPYKCILLEHKRESVDFIKIKLHTCIYTEGKLYQKQVIILAGQSDLYGP